MFPWPPPVSPVWLTRHSIASVAVTPRELARSLGLEPTQLRALIRKHRLVPSHRHNERYALDPDDVARIESHPAVRGAHERRTPRA